MKNLLLTLSILAAVDAMSQANAPVTYPKRDDIVIYAQGGSAIGAVRGWQPSLFYQIHPSIRPYLNPKDTMVLYSGRRLDSLMKVYKIDFWYVTDTLYQPVKIRK